ncbi:MAG: corrinoid protein [Candidatus Polarisedimenticolia bacterium]
MNDDRYAGIRAAVEAGDATRARAAAREAVAGGADPLDVLQEGFTRSLRCVGDLWEQGEIFLPEMMLSAEAVRAAIEELKPHLAAARRQGAPRPTCILGTVRGDIHDIGKNIVGTLLSSHGFPVVDLGTDVPVERFVGAVRETGARLVGLSALLTSTMPGMVSVVEALGAAGLRDRVRVAVGGAPVTEAYAREIGADGFAADGMSALRLFEWLETQDPGVLEQRRGATPEPGAVSSRPASGDARPREVRHVP